MILDQNEYLSMGHTCLFWWHGKILLFHLVIVGNLVRICTFFLFSGVPDSNIFFFSSFLFFSFYFIFVALLSFSCPNRNTHLFCSCTTTLHLGQAQWWYCRCALVWSFALAPLTALRLSVHLYFLHFSQVLFTFSRCFIELQLQVLTALTKRYKRMIIVFTLFLLLFIYPIFIILPYLIFTIYSFLRQSVKNMWFFPNPTITFYQSTGTKNAKGQSVMCKLVLFGFTSTNVRHEFPKNIRYSFLKKLHTSKMMKKRSLFFTFSLRKSIV